MYRRFIKIGVLFGTLGIVLGSCGGDDSGPTEPTHRFGCDLQSRFLTTTTLRETGSSWVMFTVAPNSGPAREGRITVRDKVVVITQAAQ